jgi:predicted nucleotidyltransferase
MKYQELNKELKKKLIDLSKKYKLKLFLLFGSRAKGNYNENSDWDFAFIPSKEFTIENEINLFNDLMNILNYEKIDLLNINKGKDYNIINNVFQDSILIYEYKNGYYFEKKWSAWITFQDFKKYYDLELELITKRLKLLNIK